MPTPRMNARMTASQPIALASSFVSIGILFPNVAAVGAEPSPRPCVNHVVRATLRTVTGFPHLRKLAALSAVVEDVLAARSRPNRESDGLGRLDVPDRCAGRISVPVFDLVGAIPDKHRDDFSIRPPLAVRFGGVTRSALLSLGAEVLTIQDQSLGMRLATARGSRIVRVLGTHCSNPSDTTRH